MNSILVSLLPYIIGSAVVPLQIIITVLLLKSPQRGALKAIAYVTGLTFTRILQGLLFGFVLADTAVFNSNGKNPVIAAFLLVLGIVLLIAAYKKWSGVADSEDAPPKVLTMLDRLSPLQSLGLGIGIPLIAVKLWVFTLSALATIAAAQLGQPTSAIAYLLFILLAESLLILPILLRLLLPKRSKFLLAQMSDWLTRHNRPITIAVSLIFGIYFLYSGITGLLKPAL